MACSFSSKSFVEFLGRILSLSLPNQSSLLRQLANNSHLMSSVLFLNGYTSCCCIGQPFTITHIPSLGLISFKSIRHMNYSDNSDSSTHSTVCNITYAMADFVVNLSDTYCSTTIGLSPMAAEYLDSDNSSSSKESINSSETCYCSCSKELVVSTMIANESSCSVDSCSNWFHSFVN